MAAQSRPDDNRRMNIPALFLSAAAIWGTTWFAITFQIDAIAPEYGVALRFALAAAIVLGWCRLRGIPLAMPRGEHRWLAAQGIVTYSVAYVLIYHAERFIVSGLVAVGYTLAPLVNMLLARAFFRTPMSRRVAAGGVLGIAGIVLVFWPEFAQLSASRDVALGAALTAVAVLLSCLGNMIVVRQHERGVEGWAPIGVGMAWGALCSLLIAMASGHAPTIVWSPAFVLSLLYLTIVGSVLAFGAYFALLNRIGAARAAYVGVMVPVVALIISSFFESFNWQPQTFAGIALAVAGNVLALHRPAAPSVESTA